MKHVPQGWALASLAEIAEVVAGQAPPGSSYNTEGEGTPLYQGKTDFGELYVETPRLWTTQPSKHALAQDVLLSVRAPVGPTNLATNSCAIGRGLAAIRGHEGISQRYLLYALRATVHELEARATGTTFSAITKSVVRDHIMPTAPTAEQDRIVAAIEEQFSRLDAGVAALERVRQKLGRMRAAVLRAAVTGKLVQQDPADGDARWLLDAAADARHAAITKSGREVGAPLWFSTEGLPQLPESWHWASLDSLAEVVGGITKDSKRETASNLVEVPYLRVANVQRGYLDLNRVTTIKVPPKDIERLRLASGDVLFNEGGDRDKLGRGWVWEGQIDPCIHQNHVFRARLYHPVLDPRLLSWHGNTVGQEWFSKAGKQTTNLASVSKTTLRTFPVPVPPLVEQARIVRAVEAELSIIDAIENIACFSDARSAHLRAAILSAAFSGELVPQNHSDEPASRLLERIAAKRASPAGHTPPNDRAPCRMKATA
jgi:type I restriction enzyme S subunit